MCTVTFLPQIGEGFILTSNRDEAPNRNTIAPQQYEIDGIQLLYPKDEVAGGTWIGISDKKRLVCLLNGGFTAHERANSYRMSRGVMVTQLLMAVDAISEIEKIDFTGIEPFTIILVSWEKDATLHELVWDGVRIHFVEMPWAPKIWSSSLLYTPSVKQKREQWFSRFLIEHIRPVSEEILNFHHTAGEGKIETNLIMDRGFVKTKSITQITHSENTTMRYEDLETKSIQTIAI